MSYKPGFLRFLGGLIVVVLAILICGAEEPEAATEITIPPAGFVEGWERDGETMHFVGHDLYGHINGGAELFHEFGFDSLLVQRYTKGSEELDLEVYQMSSHESAVGIYLMKVGSGEQWDGLRVRHSGSASQLSLLCGPYFIQINNFYGSEALIPDMIALANAAVAGLPEDKPLALWKHLPDSGLIEGSRRLIRGQYGLQPVYTLGPGDILRLDGKTFGVLGRYHEPDNSRFTRLVVAYEDTKMAK
ncbi:hypothetical protein GF377_00670, partial [candidate division GN15 bacterium]|nr:hypothetical protein [candidate division GN15 bacterium]